MRPFTPVKSRATPTTVSGTPVTGRRVPTSTSIGCNVICLPIASSGAMPRQNRRTAVSLRIATRGLVAESTSENSRPAARPMRMAGINFLVLYFTLKICELTFAEWSRLPLAPLITFLLMIDGGYLATFVAAGGQTIGKMATSIRVIPGHPDAGATDRVPLGQAIVRAACYGVSALPAGLGFLPGLIGPEYRALHDRLADTRVVKA